MKLFIYGPVQLDCFDSWQVVTKAGKVVATFVTRKEAAAFVKKSLTNNLKAATLGKGN